MILTLTSLPGSTVPRVSIEHLDKLVHGSLYAILAALAVEALPGARRWALFAVLAASSLFGAGDEWHQQFIVGRSQDRYDWLADTVGASLGIVFVAAARARREQES